MTTQLKDVAAREHRFKVNRFSDDRYAERQSARTNTAAFLRRFRRRLNRASSSSSLRRIPWLVALGAMLASSPILYRSYWSIIRANEIRDFQAIEFGAQTRILAAAHMLGGGPRINDDLMYIVHPNERTFEALGENDLEPPLFDLAAQADMSMKEGDEWISLKGRQLTSFTRKFDDSTSIVALVDVGWWPAAVEDRRDTTRNWMLLGALGIGAVSALATHLLLRPARRVVRDRTDFLADAAHELRTPLAVIQASAGHALGRTRPTEEYVQALSEIRTAAIRASSGVSEMLDLARFDAGQAVPRLAPLRLDLLAEELASSTRVDDCEVTAEAGPSVLVNADMALLRQALDNIVRNAASRSSRVVMRCYFEGGDGVIEVIDNGPGFKPEQLPYVFERYRRGDGRGSLGLGLPIAASIVAAHGGEISVMSPNVTEGVAEDGVDDHELPVRDIDAHGRSPGATVQIRLPRSRH